MKTPYLSISKENILYFKESFAHLTLKQFLGFLSKEDVIFKACYGGSYPCFRYHYNYKRLEFEIEELFDAILEEENMSFKGHLGAITLEEVIPEIEYPGQKECRYYEIVEESLNNENYNMHVATLIILLKVLHKQGFFNYYKLNNLKYFIEDIDTHEFSDFNKVDKYLNGEDVKFVNENYKTVVDVLLKKVEENKDRLKNISIEKCDITLIIREYLYPEDVYDPDVDDYDEDE